MHSFFLPNISIYLTSKTMEIFQKKNPFFIITFSRWIHPISSEQEKIVDFFYRLLSPEIILKSAIYLKSANMENFISSNR